MDRLLSMEGSASDKSVTNNTTTRSISRTNLINRLNFMNFQDKEILSVFKHKQYGRLLNRRVKPDPCSGKELHCSWAEPSGEYKPEDYIFDHLQLDDGMNSIAVSSGTLTFDSTGFNINLPENSPELATRKIRRHKIHGIRIQMVQNGRFYKGDLIGFTPESLKVKIQVSSRHEISHTNPDAVVSLTILKEGKIIYSGGCSIIRDMFKDSTYFCILKPIKSGIQKFKQKEFRGHRITLVPAPNLLFIHPFSGDTVNLPVSDLSGSGFSVEEYLSTSILLPGMIIPIVDIVFSTDLKISCKIQVLYKTISSEIKYETAIKVGICFLDMLPKDHVRLLSLVSKARNKHINLGQEVDAEAFWQFLFETGFIYPDKYLFVHENKQRIKDIYSKLYTKTPEIARYVTYQENGIIQGHLSMLRVYDNTWMIHHHASSASSTHYAGISVLDHLSDYIYNAYYMPSMHMDYVMCYYRPENKFPAKIFGGARKAVDNVRGCSEDEFAFLTVTHDHDIIYDETSMPQIVESSDNDLLRLEETYNKISGGILLDAMSVLPDSTKNSEIKNIYKKEGLKRDIRLLSLKQDNTLLAVFFIDITETGLNLSELTNSVKVFVLEQKLLSPEILKAALNEISGLYYHSKAHVLIFPSSYVDGKNITYQKKYVLWVTDLAYTDPYFKYVNRFFRLAGDK